MATVLGARRGPLDVKEDLFGHGEVAPAAPVLGQKEGERAALGELAGHLALGAGGAAGREAALAREGAQHGGARRGDDGAAEAGVGAPAVVDVAVVGAVEADGVRVREGVRVAAGGGEREEELGAGGDGRGGDGEGGGGGRDAENARGAGEETEPGGGESVS